MYQNTKAHWAALSLCSLLCNQLPALADEPLSISFTNKSGDVFTNLSVGKVLPDGLLLVSRAGQFKVKFGDLPPTLAEKYQASASAAAERENRENAANAAYVANQQRFQNEQAQLRLARQAQERKAPQPAAATGPNLTIDIPNKGWSIGIQNSGFGQLNKSSNGKDFTCSGMSDNGLNLSIFVEQPQGSGTGTEDVYKFYWPKASRNPLIDPQSVRMEKKPKFVKVTYTTAGMPNANFYFANKGQWVDVHISQMSDPKKADKAFANFESYLTY